MTRVWPRPLLALAPLFFGSAAFAQAPTTPSATPPPPQAPPEQAPADTSIAPSQVHLESDVTPPRTTTIPEAPLEAPPPLPHHKGVVVEGGLGALAFLGNFRHVAPTAPWFHLQAGYEIWSWLMLFAEGELAFTDTSVAETASQVYAFPLYGFGGGARITVHPTTRFAVYAQGNVNAMKADIPRGALKTLGYANAESLAPSFGGRLGVDWYQVDRHMALGLSVGARDATGFARSFGGDTGLMADASVRIGYTF